MLQTWPDQADKNFQGRTIFIKFFGVTIFFDCPHIEQLFIYFKNIGEPDILD